MRFLISLFLALALAGAQAEAQTVPLMLKGRAAAAPGAYTGPGDLKTYTVWASCSYAYSAAKRGTNACQICNPGDAACANVTSDASTGIVSSTQTIGGVTCNNSTNICTVKTFYDQTGGGGNVTQTTIANRAVFVTGCSGLGFSAPCVGFSGAGTIEYGGGFYTGSAYTLSVVAERLGAFAAQGTVLAFYPGGLRAEIGFDSSVGNAYAYQGYQTAAATDSAWHSIQAASSGLMAVESTVTSGPFGSPTALSGNQLFVGDICAFCGDPLNGRLASFGLAVSSFTTGELQAVSSSSHTVLGF